MVRHGGQSTKEKKNTSLDQETETEINSKNRGRVILPS
jgi:hypothetical protein